MSPTFEPGRALPALQVAAISRTTLALFAGASGDHNPIHGAGGVRRRSPQVLAGDTGQDARRESRKRRSVALPVSAAARS